MTAFVNNHPDQNRILAALSAEDYGRLEDDLQLVSLKAGKILYDPGVRLDYIYFPTSCVVSLTCATESGTSVELAMTGNDGLVGIALVLGSHPPTHRALVRSAGQAYRVKAEVVGWELAQGGNLRNVSLAYAHALMTQMAQNVVCNRHHSVTQQLCRWLLLNLDRSSGNRFQITQDQIANLLGVRRERVAAAAGRLLAAGLVQYSRGQITIVDRSGLLAHSCDCYVAIKREHDHAYQPLPTTGYKEQKLPDPATMRQQAKAHLKKIHLPVPATPWDSARMLHEMQVYQIELEIQNEELRRAYEDAERMRKRYLDIYDFSPVGYFTIDALGNIIDLNLAGAILLGIKRSDKGRHRFATFVVPAYRGAFSRFVTQILAATSKVGCEIALLPTEHRPEVLASIEAISDESGRECRIVVLITSLSSQPTEFASIQRGFSNANSRD